MSVVKIQRIFRITFCLLLLMLVPCAAAFAQEVPQQEEQQVAQAAVGAEDDEIALAKQSQNPVGDLISLPFQSNNFFNIGDNDRTRSLLNIQPVIPVHVGSINIINRIIVPLLSQPDLAEESGGTFGTGDTTYTAFFTPANPGKLIWGVGPVVLMPTASDDRLGGGKLGLGPSIVTLTMRGPWVIGAIVSQIWSVGGDEDRADISSFLAQYFINYNLSDGWFLTTAPIITANWKAADENTWLVPFGGGFGKVFRVGSQPLNFNTQLFYNAVRPDTVPRAKMEWRFQLSFLFPK